jgi:hypothetical protein
VCGYEAESLFVLLGCRDYGRAIAAVVYAHVLIAGWAEREIVLGAGYVAVKAFNGIAHGFHLQAQNMGYSRH